jgi:hypothetical protein
MSPRVAILLAAPFSVLAFVLGLGGKLWLEPLTWSIDPPALGLLAGLGVIVGSGAVPLGGYMLLTRSARRRPRTWQLDISQRRFVALPSPYYTGPSAVVGGWLCGGIVPTERVPDQEHMRIAQLGIETPIFIGVAAALMIMTLATLVLLAVPNRPLLSLDADGMTLQRLGRRVRLPWDELLPGGPPRPSTRNPAVLDLYQRKAVPAEGPPRRRRLAARRLHIDTTFLADTIRCYADNPDRRPGIGTADELTTLQQSEKNHTRPTNADWWGFASETSRPLR